MKEEAMIRLHFDPKPYEVGPSNGTTPVAQMNVGETQLFISVDDVVMCGPFSLRDAPSRTPHANHSIRPEVAESLEHSLTEHADIWAELARH